MHTVNPGLVRAQVEGGLSYALGEVSVPTAAPALTNAIAALTGTRIRRLPIAKTIMVY